MSIKDLVVRNRSYRGFDESRPITREELLTLVDLTRYTASSMNVQPLKYYLAWEKEKVEAIVSMTGWAGKLPKLALPFPGMHPTGFVIVCQDMRISDSATAFLKDVGIVAQTILLGATEMGLGGCMIGSFNAAALKKRLGLAGEMEPKLVIALGNPAETIVLTDVGEDGDTSYYRDDSGVHYVPKRTLEEIVL